MGDTITLGGYNLNPQNYTQDLQQGVLAGQQLRQASALQSMDPNDPASVNSAMNALIKNGGAQQAGVLAALQEERAKITQRQAARQDLAKAQETQSSDAPNPETATSGPDEDDSPQHTMAARQAGLGLAQEGVEQLLAIKDPVERINAASDLKEKALAAGIPEQFIDSALSDLSDAHLTSIDANLKAAADHQAFGGQNQGPLELHPSTQAAAQHSASLTDPRIMKALTVLAANGGDVGGAVEAIKQGMGYQGPVGPGTTVIQNGQQVTRSPYAPTPLTGTQSSTEKLVNPETGATIAQAAPVPSLQQVGPAATAGVFTPGQAGGSFTPPETAQGGAGAPSATHGGYAPSVPASAVVRAVQANPSRYLSAIVGGPVQITSGARSPDKNAAVGGVPSSEHVPGQGEAYDFKAPPGMTNQEVVAKLLQARIPFDQVIDEGDHIHIGWGPKMRGEVMQTGAGPGGAQTPTQLQAQGSTGGGIGPDGFIHGRTMSAPMHVPGMPEGSLAQITPEGGISPVAGTVNDASTLAGLRAQAMGPQYQAAQAAISAYNTAKANAGAGKMTGPAALAILQQASGTTGASAEDTLKSFGLWDQGSAKVRSALLGKGTLSPDMQQQILDVVQRKAQVAYDQAASVNGVAAKQEQQFGLAPGSTQAPLPARPNRFYALPPAPSDRVVGQYYETPRGVHMWTGTGWK